MAVVDVLQDLWRHRRLVILGICIATAALIMIMYRVGLAPPKLESRQYHVGVASAAVLIDSQSSQTVDLGDGADGVEADVGSLSVRAKLLANLLVTRPLRDDIASGGRVAPDELITQLSSTTDPGTPPTEATDSTVRPDDPRANIVSLQTSETVPIITINAQAPTEETAARLATSTVATLRDYLTSVAADNRVPDVRKLVMRQLGEPSSATSQRGPGKSGGVTIFVLLLVFWCGAILAVSALSRAWRQAVADDLAGEFPSGGPPAADLPFDPEPEAPGGPLPLRIREGADDELGSPPPAKTTSRVA
jgi:hypothetical protein